MREALRGKAEYGKKDRGERLMFAAGLAAVLLTAVPYLLLGTDAIVTYHDQLDGEVIAYLLQAKHLFRGSLLPEFLGGASKTALILPAPACVLLFSLMEPFAAYVAMQALGSLTGYVGMYLLSKKAAGKGWIAAAVGLLYACLPFLPVYGLSQYGIPLLLWCFWEMKEGRRRKTGFLYTVFFALSSSLVLVGFALLGALGVFLLWEWLHRRRSGILALSWLAMAVVYLLENLRLLAQLLGVGGKEISHKAEYALEGEGFWSGLKTAFLQGGEHSVDFHGLILAAALTVIFVCFLTKREELRRTALGMLAILACNFVLALTAALWNSGAGVFLRSRMAALGAFQLDRVLWIAPALWYLLLACALGAALALWRTAFSAGGKAKAAALLLLACVLALGALTGLRVLRGSHVKPNLQKCLNPSYDAISYGDYYALGVMEQVEEYIRKNTGMEQPDYRTASLGIDPAAALYAGFYTVDGYSNNYALDYKHSFREVIAPELEKSEYLRDYFDGWGNRCYLLSAECPGYFTVEKGGFFFQDLDLDTEALKRLGCRYVLSAAYILNGEETGLYLVREEPFEAPESYYRIYLYEVRGESE